MNYDNLFVSLVNKKLVKDKVDVLLVNLFVKNFFRFKVIKLFLFNFIDAFMVKGYIYNLRYVNYIFILKNILYILKNFLFQKTFLFNLVIKVTFLNLIEEIEYRQGLYHRNKNLNEKKLQVESIIYKNNININKDILFFVLDRIKNNSIVRFLFDDFFIQKKYYNLIYNEKVGLIKQFNILLYNKKYSVEFFNTKILNLLLKDYKSLNIPKLSKNNVIPVKTINNQYIYFDLMLFQFIFELEHISEIGIYRKKRGETYDKLNIVDMYDSLFLLDIAGGNNVLYFYILEYFHYKKLKNSDTAKYDRFKQPFIFHKFFQNTRFFPASVYVTFMDFYLLNLSDYMLFIFYDEYNFNYIHKCNFVCLYDVLLYYNYVFKNHLYDYSILMLDKDIYTSIYTYKYISNNILYETQTLWDMYIYYITESYYTLINNIYLYKKYEPFINQIYNNVYKNKDFFIKKRKRRRLQRFRPYKKLVRLHENFSIIVDMDFYVNYNDLYRQMYLIDQDIYSYIHFESFVNNDINLNLINKRFFRYLESVLIGQIGYNAKYNANSYYVNVEPFTYDKLYTASKNTDVNANRHMIIDHYFMYEKNIRQDFTSQYNFGVKKNIGVAWQLYDFLDFTSTKINGSTELLFDRVSKHFLNINQYMGFKVNYKFLSIDYFIYNFFFDYYLYTIKVLTLDYILYQEYNIKLSSNYNIGPIKEYAMLANVFLKMRDRFFIRWRNFSLFWLDFDFFEKFNFSLFGVTVYYGFFIQFPFFSLIFFFKMIYVKVKGFRSIYKFRDEFFRYEKLLEYYYEFFLSSKIYTKTPHFGAFDFPYTYSGDVVDGYYDQDFLIPANIAESLGFNEFLNDIDNRYFLRDGSLSSFMNLDTSGFGHIYMYMHFFYDCVFLIFIQLSNFLYEIFFFMFMI